MYLFINKEVNHQLYHLNYPNKKKNNDFYSRYHFIVNYTYIIHTRRDNKAAMIELS